MGTCPCRGMGERPHGPVDCGTCHLAPQKLGVCPWPSSVYAQTLTKVEASLCHCDWSRLESQEAAGQGDTPTEVSMGEEQAENSPEGGGGSRTVLQALPPAPLSH